MEVSVLCLAYNHEQYIEKCLSSIIRQKTTFDFEIIVNDDASTDNTINIIKKFEKKYPHKVKGIYQEQNRYSQGKAIIEEYMLPVASGKYIALCECDDLWLDDSKLQKQYDYMEKHPECSLCSHNTLIHCVNEKKDDSRFNDWTSIHKMSEREAFMEWKIHTSSFFMTRDNGYRPESTRKYWFGDYVRVTDLFLKGNIEVLPEIMSQYNYGIKSGALYSADNDKISNIRNNILQRKEYLLELKEDNKASKYLEIINERIFVTELEAETVLENNVINSGEDYSLIRKAAKSIKQKKEFKMCLKHMPLKQKLKMQIKYQLYILCPSIMVNRGIRL